MLYTDKSFLEYIVSGNPFDPYALDDIIYEINGFRIRQSRFLITKKKARALVIALYLAKKKTHVYRQRMGDQIIETTSPRTLSTSECIDVIMFEVIPDIELSINTLQPDKSARDSMKLVSAFFENAIVELKTWNHKGKMYYLELRKD